MYVPCLWELYYCVSLAMRRVECVKCVEDVWCSCWCTVHGYVGRGVLFEWKWFTDHTLGCWWSAVRSRAAGYASGMRKIARLTLSCGAWVGWMVFWISGKYYVECTYILTNTLRCFFLPKWITISELTVSSNRPGSRKVVNNDYWQWMFVTSCTPTEFPAMNRISLHFPLWNLFVVDTPGCWSSVSMASVTTQRTTAPSCCH